MKLAVFSTKSYDQQFLRDANAHHGHELSFFEARLSDESDAPDDAGPSQAGVAKRLSDDGTVELQLGTTTAPKAPPRTPPRAEPATPTAFDRTVWLESIADAEPAAIAEYLAG
ncbi:MAG: hypothetical protein AAF961_12310, partial [Planctomycetota bacterium]